MKRNLNICMLRKKEKGAFHEFNWVNPFPAVLYFLCQKA